MVGESAEKSLEVKGREGEREEAGRRGREGGRDGGQESQSHSGADSCSSSQALLPHHWPRPLTWYSSSDALPDTAISVSPW